MSAVAGVEGHALKELWRRRWPACPPIGYELRSAYPDVWVRFHSLPESKRYADDDDEYTVILERYDTVLDELFAGMDVYVVEAVADATPEVPRFRPDANHWMTVLVDDDPDPEFRTYFHLYWRRLPWEWGVIDDLLLAVADDKVPSVFITDTRMRRVHHPYDGGADVLLATPVERELLRGRYRDWLSGHPSGQ